MIRWMYFERMEEKMFRLVNVQSCRGGEAHSFLLLDGATRGIVHELR